MRFILIDVKHRRVWNWQYPANITHDLICRFLQCDWATRVELADDVDLWTSGDAKNRQFELPAGEPAFSGNGVICGRSKLGDCKGLPLRISVDMIQGMIAFPKHEATRTFPRRAITQGDGARRWSPDRLQNYPYLAHPVFQRRPIVAEMVTL